MQFKYIVIFIFLIFLSSLVVHASEPQIIVLPEVPIEKDTVTFGDISEIKNLPDEVKTKIQKLPICNAPGAGEVRKMTNFAISELIRSGFQDISGGNELLNEIKFKIPSEVLVYSKFFKLKKESLENLIGIWAQESCLPCDVRFYNLNMPNIEGVSGLAQWHLVKTSVPPRGYFTAQIQVLEKSKEPKNFWINGELRLFKKVPVVQRAFLTGQKIFKEDFKVESRDITFSREVIPSEIEILSSEIARPITTNDIIWKSSLKRKLAVQRGQPVNLVIRNENWNVNVKGISEGFGYIGDVIRVLNSQTNKIVAGVLIDEGMVEIK